MCDVIIIFRISCFNALAEW